MQDCVISIADIVEISQSYTKPFIRICYPSSCFSIPALSYSYNYPQRPTSRPPASRDCKRKNAWELVPVTRGHQSCRSSEGPGCHTGLENRSLPGDSGPETHRGPGAGLLLGPVWNDSSQHCDYDLLLEPERTRGTISGYGLICTVSYHV